MNSNAVLKRTCMRDRIRDTLVSRILDGTYPAGTQLKELYLAREFDVSQAPIREALRELEGSGLVSSERFRGTRVKGADFAEMRESYELRMMLEMRSVSLAAPYEPELLDEIKATAFGGKNNSSALPAPACTKQAAQPSLGRVPEMSDYTHVYANTP